MHHEQTCLHPGNPLFYLRQFWAGIQKVFIVKGDMPDNSKSVCDNVEFKNKTEMSVNIKLFNSEFAEKCEDMDL